MSHLHSNTSLLSRALSVPRLLVATSVLGCGAALLTLGISHRHMQQGPALTAPAAATPQHTVSASQPTQAAPAPAKKRFNPLRGIASWYGSVLHGHPTASGEIFDETQMTACHNSLPFGTRVKVTNLLSRKSVIVRINDRGVLAANRVIDLSSAAAEKLGILRAGVAPVKLEVLKKTDSANGTSSN